MPTSHPDGACGEAKDKISRIRHKYFVYVALLSATPGPDRICLQQIKLLVILAAPATALKPTTAPEQSRPDLSVENKLLVILAAPATALEPTTAPEQD